MIECRLDDKNCMIHVAGEALVLIGELHKALASNKTVEAVALAKAFEETLRDETFWCMLNQRTYDELMSKDEDADED